MYFYCADITTASGEKKGECVHIVASFDTHAYLS